MSPPVAPVAAGGVRADEAAPPAKYPAARLPRPRAWQALAAVGLALGAIRLTLPVQPWTLMDPLIAGAAAAASFTGARRLPRARRLPWMLFGLAQAATTGYAILVLLGLLAVTPGALVVAFGGLYGLAMVGFLLIWRSLGPADLDAWLDSCIVAAAIGLLAWTFLSDGGAGATVEVPPIVAGVADLALLLVVARLFVNRVGPRSFLILIAALCLMVGLYVTQYLIPADPEWLARAATGAWVVGYAAWGALAIHPAAATVGMHRKPPSSGTPRRTFGFLLILAVVLATPSVAFARVISLGSPPATTGFLVGTAALAALMFLRAARILRHLERDVAQRKAAELAAVESRQQLAAYQALVPVGIFAADDDLRLHYANRWLLRLFGLPETPTPATSWLTFIHPEDRSRAEDARRRGIAEASEWSTEVRALVAQGGERWVAIRAQPAESAAGAAGRWIGSVTDITPQVIARLAAEQREALVQALVDQSPIGIGIFAPDGRALAANAAMRRLFDGTPLESTASLGNVLENPYCRENGIAERLAPAFAGRAVEFGPVPFAVHEGQQPLREATPQVHLRVTLFPVKAAGGEILRVIGFFVDATTEMEAAGTQRRIEEELRETQKLEALGVLAGGIAHDFNNLLVPILGSIGIARAEVGPHSPLAHDLAQAEAAAERAADLARQMLAYSGRATFVTSTVRLDEVVRGMAELLERSIAKGGTLALDLEPGAWVVADATHLRQVTLNLIVNASDALIHGGRILVRTGVREIPPQDPHLITGSEAIAGRCAWLAVSDTGAGMDGDTLARAFEPFFSTKGAGRGLGLATTLGIVRSLHGALRVRTGPGAGSSFEVFLPLAAAPLLATPAPAATLPGFRPAPQRPGSPIPAPSSAGTILLVDDEDGVRRLARRVLERAGYAVIEAVDGVAALDAFAVAQDRLSGVLLDITLPRLDGLSVLRELHEVRPELPVVISSGWSRDEVPEGILRPGSTRFLQKPYRPEDLLGELRAAIESGARGGVHRHDEREARRVDSAQTPSRSR